MKVAPLCLVGIVAATLGGCAEPPPPRPQPDPAQVVAGSPEEALTRAEGALEDMGFNAVVVDSATGRLQAQQQDLDETRWAQCPDPWVFDRDDGQRRRKARPLEIDLDLRLTTEAQPDGTLVTVRPRFERTYVNSFTNLDFTRRCRSIGTLERAIFERLQAA